MATSDKKRERKYDTVTHNSLSRNEIFGHSVVTRQYYGDTLARTICHAVKNNDTYAIIDMAKSLISTEMFNEHSVLIPAPQHIGHAVYTKAVANIIAEQTGAKVADILKCTPRESLFLAKQRGKKISPMLYLDGTVPQKGNLCFIDNVIDTGATYLMATKIIGLKLVPTIYANV